MSALDPEAYLQQRFNEQLSWLSKASRSNKQAFLRLRLLEILLGSSITVFSPFAADLPLGSLLIALAGGGVVISGSVLALNRHQENWLRYRNLAEALKREKFLYLTAAPPYGDQAKAFHRFVSRAEALMGQESAVWLSQMSQKADQSVQQDDEDT
ncbi:MAG: hypothetical protein RLZZ124_1113 [Cyanobacteriota bacterium]